MCISQHQAVEVAINGCENLSHWINRLKAKEAILKSSHKNRDLRREVLLNHAAQKAQEQLSHQQLLNRQRWTDFKARDLQQCKICLATPNFCTCTSNELSEESRKFDDFFASLSVNSKKRKKPTILRSNDCKRIKVWLLFLSYILCEKPYYNSWLWIFIRKINIFCQLILVLPGGPKDPATYLLEDNPGVTAT